MTGVRERDREKETEREGESAVEVNRGFKKEKILLMSEGKIVSKGGGGWQ